MDHLHHLILCKVFSILLMADKRDEAVRWRVSGSDSHTAFTPGHFDHCLRIAREVDFQEDRVLNVTPRRLLDFLEMRSGRRIAELADF